MDGLVERRPGEVVAVEVLPPILAALQDQHPALALELSASDAVEDLLHRAADIAVRMTRPAQAALVVRRIGSVPLGMFARATSRATGRRVRSPSSRAIA